MYSSIPFYTCRDSYNNHAKTILSPQRPIGVISLKDWGKCKKSLTLFRSLYPVSFLLWLSSIFPLHILSSTSDDTVPIASTIRHYLNNSREEGKPVVLMFLFVLFLLPSWCSKSSSFIISFLLYCTAFNHSFRVSLLSCQVLIAFLFLRISWFLPHFWRIFSLNIASSLGSSFNTWNMLCHFLWSPWFLVRNHWFLNCFPLLIKWYFSLTAFKTFSWSGFSKFEYVLAWISLLFGICSASWICRFMSFARLGNFQPSFLEDFFGPLSLSSSGTPWWHEC